MRHAMAQVVGCLPWVLGLFPGQFMRDLQWTMRWYNTLVSHYTGFPPSVSFHKCPTCIQSSTSGTIWSLNDIDRFALDSSPYGPDAPTPYGPLCPIIWYQLRRALFLYKSSRWPQDLKS